MFAFRHPHEVAGIVLIDPAAPYQNRRLGQAAPHTYAAIDAIQQEQIADLKSCIDMLQRRSQDATFAAKCLSPPMPDYPASLNRALNQLERNANAKANFQSLLDNAFTAKDSQEIEASWKSLGSLPLIVLTAGELPPIPLDAAGLAQKPQLQAEWSKMHDEIAALSTHGVNRTVPGATHYIYVDRHAVVVDAILEVLGAARRRP
jgi:pimeloyl-ACP methyl ester carboxylesterase